MLRQTILLFALCGAGTALADPVGVTGSSVYVTRADCQALVHHHPAPEVAYQPGVDVHGKYVAPADLPGNGPALQLPDKIAFDLKLNPLTYSQSNAATSGKFANTAMPLGRIAVDMKTGEASLNGKPLADGDDRLVVEACRKAGFR